MNFTADTLNTYRTGNTAVDWMIARINVLDSSDSNGVYLIGEFKGTLPSRMLEQVEAHFLAVTGEKFKKVYNITDDTTYDLQLSYRTGSFKSTGNKITFYISFVK